MIRRYISITAGMLLLASASVAARGAEDRDSKVRGDRREFESAENWIYDDLDRGIALAAAANKPLLIVLRCIP